MSRRFINRAIVALAVLTITLIVSVIWQRMVYTIPVLACLLFLAAGLKSEGSTTRRKLDDDATDFDMSDG